MLLLQTFGTSLIYKVQISVEAKRDAKNYASYIRNERGAPKAATARLDGLLTEMKALALNPTRFAVIAESEILNFQFRAFNYYSHRVVFAVHAREKRVVIHRVWHGARELHAFDFH